MVDGVGLGWVLGDGVGSASAGPTGQNRINNTTASHAGTRLRLVMDLTIHEPREQISWWTIINSSLAGTRGKRTPPSSCVGRAIGPGSDQDFRAYCPGPRQVLLDVSPSRPVGHVNGHGMRAARIRDGSRSIHHPIRRGVLTAHLMAARAAQAARRPRQCGIMANSWNPPPATRPSTPFVGSMPGTAAYRGGAGGSVQRPPGRAQRQSSVVGVGASCLARRPASSRTKSTSRGRGSCTTVPGRCWRRSRPLETSSGSGRALRSGKPRVGDRHRGPSSATSEAGQRHVGQRTGAASSSIPREPHSAMLSGRRRPTFETVQGGVHGAWADAAQRDRRRRGGGLKPCAGARRAVCPSRPMDPPPRSVTEGGPCSASLQCEGGNEQMAVTFRRCRGPPAGGLKADQCPPIEDSLELRLLLQLSRRTRFHGIQ